MHYWADLQSVHGFRCCDNIAPNAKCQRVLVLAVFLVPIWNSLSNHLGRTETANTFKNRLDKFWSDQEVLYDYKAALNGMGNRGIALELFCVLIKLVHGQVTIIFVVSVCLFLCLFVQSFSQPSLIRFRSN